MAALSVSQASRLFGIYPNSRKAHLVAWKIADEKSRDYKIRSTAYGIRYAIHTGRISGDAVMKLRKMSPYQTLKLFVEVFNNTEVQADIPRYLNEVLYA